MKPTVKLSSSTLILSLLLLCALVWGSYLRISALPNASLWMDEGYSYQAAKTLLETGGITLETGEVYGRHSVVFHGLQALSMAVFGENEWGLRFPSLFFGIFFPLLCFFGLRNLFPKRKLLSFIVPIVLFLSQWQIVWSLQGRMYMVLQVFFCSALFFLWKWLEVDEQKKKWHYGIAFCIFSLLSFYTHPFGFILMPIALLSIAILERSFWKKPAYWLTALAVIALFVVWKHAFIFSRLLNGEFWAGFYGRFFMDQHIGIVLLSIFSLFLLLTGTKENRRWGIFLLISLVLPLVVLFFGNTNANYRYLFPLFPLLVIASFSWLLLPYCQHRKGVTALLAIGSVFLLSPELQLTAQPMYSLESDLPKYTGYRLHTPQPDYRAAFTWSKGDSERIILTTAPEIGRFYGVEADYVLPFGWSEQLAWETVQTTKPEYVAIPHIYDLRTLHEIVSTNLGYVVIDDYAWSKLPSEVTGYIDTNMRLVWEQWEDQDSGVLVYAF